MKLHQQINANEERNKRSVANEETKKKKKKMADQMAVGIHLGKKEDVSPIIT